MRLTILPYCLLALLVSDSPDLFLTEPTTGWDSLVSLPGLFDECRPSLPAFLGLLVYYFSSYLFKSYIESFQCCLLAFLNYKNDGDYYSKALKIKIRYANVNLSNLQYSVINISFLLAFFLCMCIYTHIYTKSIL